MNCYLEESEKIVSHNGILSGGLRPSMIALILLLLIRPTYSATLINSNKDENRLVDEDYTCSFYQVSLWFKPVCVC